MDRKAFFESIRKASPSANLNRENGQFGPETLIAPEESNPGIQGLSGPKGLTRRTNTGTAAYKGTFGKDELMHLLRRTLFGVKISDYNVYKGKTLEQAVDALLNVSTTLPNPPVNNYGNLVKDPNVPYGSTWVNAALDPAVEPQRKGSVKSWFWGQMVTQSPDIQAKMVLFWHNHFAIQFLEIPDARACYVYTKVLYTHALGNFKDLTRAVTIDPAMLFYLNGRLNTKRAPDENYARELQELFTLGKGPNSKFTEDDVKAMARVLTGWSINPLTNPFSTAFVSVNHDSSDKQFSSFYGNTLIKGQTGINAGNTELDDLLTMIFKVDEVALFLCRKLYEYFVYYEIDDTVEANVIVPLAKVFRDSGYSIKAVLKTLLMSEHFFDSWNRACVIKDPLTQQVGFCREMELKFPASTDYFLLYQMYQMGMNFGQLTQLNLGDPPNVAGWPAWYQKPLFHRSWINSDTLPKRNQFTDYLLFIGHKVGSFTLMADVWIFTKQLTSPGDADDLIAESVSHLLPMSISAAQTATLKEILLPGGIPDYNWSDEYRAATDASDPNHTTAKSTATVKIQYLIKSIMNLSEYQLS
ncbi:MAG: hypothetical protein RLZZ548_33 [Bacteroidota bacterium]|jgi:uncharacterized protein (DUF1800 family)